MIYSDKIRMLKHLKDDVKEISKDRKGVGPIWEKL